MKRIDILSLIITVAALIVALIWPSPLTRQLAVYVACATAAVWGTYLIFNICGRGLE